MNEKVWKNIFKKYIQCYESIECLRDNHIIEPDDSIELKRNLLDDIIETFKQEVE